MVALTSNYEAKRQDGVILTYPVKTAVRIYKGALVCVGTADGYAFPAAFGTNRKFVGVCVEEANNSSGADAAIQVRVYAVGTFQYAKVSAAAADLSDIAYTVDDNTVGTTVTNSVVVGFIVGIVNSSTVKVAITPYK